MRRALAPLEPCAQHRPDPPDRERGQRGERAHQRSSEQLDPGSEHQSEEEEGAPAVIARSSEGEAVPRRARRRAASSPATARKPEREDRIHEANVRARLTRAQGAP